ncbi:hypothetical protein I7I51_01979 [Histoplasma capsulatum]|uniref:Protein kinase domain-containing protein n=1 Tax=Ajellomyces capsulatus TaxID=5037 RepID=A0A8A1MJV6_AJECA|nr:predicted protein [Histoplasma mississippiense (nom. inval.)]EDN05106.1 predicted protein [Histoplasma mississippiense (nom. inval.)]QSS64904.1 hypothetical protein I7I51_01979 [Histoplasma capsulatum]
MFPRSGPVPSHRITKRVIPLSNAPRGPKLRRMLPVGTQVNLPAGKPTHRPQLLKEVANPWDQYQQGFNLDQAGPGILVNAKNDSFDEMIAKRAEVDNQEWLSKLKPIAHKNIVKLCEALYHEGAIFLFYEVMDVSLADIFSTPYGILRPYQVAAFCKEILNGLDFLHAQQLVAGELCAENVLLSVNPVAVKIGNIGATMLTHAALKVAQDDIRALGQIIVRCLEAPNALRGADALTPGRWEAAMSEFQMLTKTRSVAELLQHGFVQRSPGPKCLRLFIRAARESAPKSVEIRPDREDNITNQIYPAPHALESRVWNTRGIIVVLPLDRSALKNLLPLTHPGRRKEPFTAPWGAGTYARGEYKRWRWRDFEVTASGFAPSFLGGFRVVREKVLWSILLDEPLLLQSTVRRRRQCWAAETLTTSSSLGGNHVLVGWEL